jgi:hypothetical protein
MWNILKAELSYSRFAFIVFFATIPLLVVLGAVSGGVRERAYVVWFVILMAVNYWNATRIKEKRDFQLAQLPVTRKNVGRARASMIVVTTASYLIVYGIVRSAFARGGLNPQHALLIFGFVVAIYSALLMFRDRYVGTKSLMRGKALLVAVLGVLFGAGIYAMIVTDEAVETGGEPPMFLRAIDYVFRHSPLGHPVFLTCFVAASLLLAYLSVITFQRRKTNVE